MRKLPSILIAAALGAASLSSLTIPAFAADQDDSVKTARPPYKPGRELNEDAAAQGGGASEGGEQPVKSARPPYKPGREADEGREADHQ